MPFLKNEIKLLLKSIFQPISHVSFLKEYALNCDFCATCNLWGIPIYCEFCEIALHKILKFSFGGCGTSVISCLGNGSGIDWVVLFSTLYLQEKTEPYLWSQWNLLCLKSALG